MGYLIAYLTTKGEGMAMRKLHPLNPAIGYPKAMGHHPVKDISQAGGPGYKCVSLTSFKVYPNEVKGMMTMQDREVLRALRSGNVNIERLAAHELVRRHRLGRQLPFQKGDGAIIGKYSNYFNRGGHKSVVRPIVREKGFVRHRIF